MTNTISQTISLDEARKIATEQAAYHLEAIRKDKSMPLLQDSYLETDYCWMFFRNKGIVLAPEQALSGWAYCVSKKGHARSIADFSDDMIRVHEYLQTISNYFKEKGL